MGKTIKNHCIRGWNNLKKDLSDIHDSELSLTKIKGYLKQTWNITQVIWICKMSTILVAH